MATKQQDAYLRRLVDGGELCVREDPDHRWVGSPLCTRYRFDRIVGSGGLAVVARLLPLLPENDVVVLKVLHEDLQAFLWKYLEHESKLLKESDSPHVVGWRGCAATSESRPGLLLEWAGETRLDKWLLRYLMGGGLPAAERHVLFSGCLEAIAYLHEARLLVHGDVRPENFMVMSTGHVKVIDLMFSDFARSQAKVRGTSEYLTPEAALSTRPQTFTDDLFALTLVYAEMLIGHAVNRSDLTRPNFSTGAPSPASPQEVFAFRQDNLRFLHRRVIRLDPETIAFIRRGTSLDPAKRFTSISQMREAFALIRV